MKDNGKDVCIVSIVVPAYNEEKYIDKCLDCLQSQICDWQFEILVVDNNSTDATRAIAELRGVQVISEPVKGIAKARQKGLDYAAGSLIASVDADTEVPVNWLQTLCQVVADNPNVVGVTCPFNYSNHTFMPIIAKLWFNILFPVTRRVGSLAGRGYFPLAGPSYIVRADAMREIGGFDTSLTTCDDLDISIKLLKLGKILLVSDVYTSTSARRFNANFFGTCLLYISNYLSMTFVMRPLRNKYPDYR